MFLADPLAPETIATIFMAAGMLVGIAIWLRRSRSLSVEAKADDAQVPPKLMARVQEERDRAARVEEFEKLVAAKPSAGDVMAGLEKLDEAARRSLSSECSNMIGFALADAGRAEAALLWLDEGVNRDEDYFRALNMGIADEMRALARNAIVPDYPRYPFHIVAWPGLAVRTEAKARLLHQLGRHVEVEAELAMYVADTRLRYIRAEYRRLRGATEDALSDYKAVAARQQNFEQVQRWIAELSAAAGKPPPPPKAERTHTPQPGPAVAQQPTPPPAPPPAPSPLPPHQPSHQPSPAAAAPPPPPPLPPPPPRQPAAQAQAFLEDHPDPRAVLGVGPSATDAEIRAAYLSLARQYHPDLVAGLGKDLRVMAETKMREINYAWMELNKENPPLSG